MRTSDSRTTTDRRDRTRSEGSDVQPRGRLFLLPDMTPAGRSPLFDQECEDISPTSGRILTLPVAAPATGLLARWARWLSPLFVDVASDAVESH